MMANRVQHVIRPSARDVAKRLIILKQQVTFASMLFSFSNVDQGAHGRKIDDIDHLIKGIVDLNQAWVDYAGETGLGSLMTGRERVFLTSDTADIDYQQVMEAYRSKESAITLLWALGIIGSREPLDTESDKHLMSQVPLWDIGTFLDRVKLRDIEEIERYLVKAELWLCRSRERSSKNEPAKHGIVPDTANRFRESQPQYKLAADAPPFLIGGGFPAFERAFDHLHSDERDNVNSIVLERYRALTWLCGKAPGNDWDFIFKDDPIPMRPGLERVS